MVRKPRRPHPGLRADRLRAARTTGRLPGARAPHAPDGAQLRKKSI